MQTGTDRRKSSRINNNSTQPIRLSYAERAGEPRREVLANVVDASEDGCRVSLSRPLTVGSAVYLNRDAVQGGGKHEPCTACVEWCRQEPGGFYAAGLKFEAKRPTYTPNGASNGQTQPEPEVEDHYDTLQLSRKADHETIQRVYRLLAQRFHPDNPDTGNAEVFRRLLEAYRVLSDPEQRAAYDVKYGNKAERRWNIFDPSSALPGRNSEKRKRNGILSVLYTRRVNEPSHPAMTLPEIEELLGCPREHLEFSLWFLKEKGFIARGDNGRFTITANGAEEAERDDLPWAREDRLLGSPEGAA